MIFLVLSLFSNCKLVPLGLEDWIAFGLECLKAGIDVADRFFQPKMQPYLIDSLAETHATRITLICYLLFSSEFFIISATVYNQRL